MRLTLVICPKTFVGWLATGLVFEAVWAVGLVVGDGSGVVVAEGPAKEGFDGPGVFIAEGPAKKGLDSLGVVVVEGPAKGGLDGPGVAVEDSEGPEG